MATLGETLKEQREHLGLSLESAEEATRIRARLLEMLENDDYDHLPNPGYVKGYVASYAKYLELDPIEMVDLYRRQIGDMHVHEINVGAEPVVAPTREQHALPWKTAVAVVAVIGIVAAAIWGISTIVRPKSEPLPVLPNTQGATPTETPSAESTAKPKTKPKSSGASSSAETSKSASGSTSASTTKPFELVVAVASGERSWLRITVDEKVKYEGVLDGGEKSYTVKKSAKVRIGAPGAVTVTKDGEEVKIPDGEIPTVELKATAQ